MTDEPQPSARESILVVEDDEFIARLLKAELAGAGYEVRIASDGVEALDAAFERCPDLVLADVMMPNMDGYEMTRRLREDPRTEAVSIIMLTARGVAADKLEGLTAGADDYIVKPFGVNELLARIRAHLRKARVKPPVKTTEPLAFGDVVIDPRTYKGTKGGRTFSVSARELSLLRFFLSHDGEVVERFTLLDKIWGVRYEGTTRTLDQHIAKLRQKIEDDPAAPRFIQTAHGVGYRFSSRP